MAQMSEQEFLSKPRTKKEVRYFLGFTEGTFFNRIKVLEPELVDKFHYDKFQRVLSVNIVKFIIESL